MKLKKYCRPYLLISKRRPTSFEPLYLQLCESLPPCAAYSHFASAKIRNKYTNYKEK